MAQHGRSLGTKHDSEGAMRSMLDQLGPFCYMAADAVAGVLTICHAMTTDQSFVHVMSVSVG